MQAFGVEKREDDQAAQENAQLLSINSAAPRYVEWEERGRERRARAGCQGRGPSGWDLCPVPGPRQIASSRLPNLAPQQHTCHDLNSLACDRRYSCPGPASMPLHVRLPRCAHLQSAPAPGLDLEPVRGHRRRGRRGCPGGVPHGAGACGHGGRLLAGFARASGQRLVRQRRSYPGGLPSHGSR